MYVTKTRIFWFIFICLIFGLWIYHKNNIVKLKQTNLSSPTTVINPFIPYDNNLSTPDMKTKYVKFYSELFKTPHVFAEDLWVCRDNISGEMGYYQPNLNCCMTRSGRKTDYGIMDTNYEFTWKTIEPTFPLYNMCGLTIVQLKPIEEISDNNWTYNPVDNTIILSRFGKQTLSLVTDSTNKVNVFLVELSRVEELGVDDKWIYDSVTQKIELKSLSNISTTRKFLTVEYFYDQEGVDLSKIYLNPQTQDTWSINTDTKKIIWNNFNARTNKQNVTLGLTPLRIIGNWNKSGNQYTCQVNSEILKINSITSNFFFLNREFTNSLTHEAVVNNPQLNKSVIDCQISWNTDICSNPCSSITYLNEPDPSFKYITQPPLYGGKKCRDTIIDTGDIKEQVNYWQNNCWVCSEGTLCILSQKRIWEGYFSDGPQTRLLTVNPNFGTNTGRISADDMTVATTEKLQCQTERIYFEIITQKTENWIQYIKIKNKNSGLYAKFSGDHARGGRLNFNESISNASIFRLVYDGIRIIERVDSLNDKIILPSDPVSSVEIVPNTTNNLIVGSKIILLNGIGKLTSTTTIQAITNLKQFQLNSPPTIPLQDASIIIIPPNINRNSGYFHLFTPEQPWNGMKCAPSLKAYIENVSSDYVKSDEEKTSTDYAIEKTEDPYVNSVFVLQNGIFCNSNTECLSFQECKDVTDPTSPFFKTSKGKMCQTKGETDDSNYKQWESTVPPRVIKLSTIETYEQPTTREMIVKTKTLVEQEIRPYDIMSITNGSVNQSTSNTSTSNQKVEVGKLASWVNSGDFIENDIFFYGGKTMIQGVDPERKRIVGYAAPKNPIPSEGITINIRRTPKLFFSSGSPIPSWVREGDIVYNPEFFEKDTRILKIINNKTCVLDKPSKKTLTNQPIIIMRWYNQSVNNQTGDIQYYFDANKFGDCRGLVFDMSEGYFNKFMPGDTTRIRFKTMLTYPEDYISDKCFPPLDTIPTNFSIVSVSTISNASKVYRFKPNAVFKIPGLIFTGVDNVPYYQEMQIIQKTSIYILVQSTNITAYRVNQVYRAPDQTFWVIDSMLSNNNQCTYAGIEESTCTIENRTWVKDDSTGQSYLSVDNIPGCYQTVWKWRC